MTSHVKDANID